MRSTPGTTSCPSPTSSSQWIVRHRRGYRQQDPRDALAERVVAQARRSWRSDTGAGTRSVAPDAATQRAGERDQPQPDRGASARSRGDARSHEHGAWRVLRRARRRSESGCRNAKARARVWFAMCKPTSAADRSGKAVTAWYLTMPAAAFRLQVGASPLRGAGLSCFASSRCASRPWRASIPRATRPGRLRRRWSRRRPSRGRGARALMSVAGTRPTGSLDELARCSRTALRSTTLRFASCAAHVPVVTPATGGPVAGPPEPVVGWGGLDRGSCAQHSWDRQSGASASGQ